MQKAFHPTGFYPADILVPKAAYLSSWCAPPVDQHTSEPEFWESLRKAAGNNPTALDLVLPEAYLGTAGEERMLSAISGCMKRYEDAGIFREISDSYLYIEREQSTGLFREGLLGVIDLEEYDFDPRKKALIRATEKTVPERLPPRVRVREKASLELPHVLVLYNDPERRMKKALTETLARLKGEPVYDFTLPVCGHRIRGRAIPSSEGGAIRDTLESLLTGSFLAVGDGNHSLAAAKALYERKRADPATTQGELDLSRFALVELVACQDEAMPFLPIHRLVFTSPADLRKRAERLSGSASYSFRLYSGEGEEELLLRAGEGLLPVAVLQDFLDAEAIEADYIHDEDTLLSLVAAGRGTGILLPGLDRGMLFPAVEKRGVLPRKTFSLGRAEDKRFYLEARKIAL